MSKIMKTMDGNEAAAYASYAFTEVAAIYPITPSSPMAEHVDAWAAHGKKNIFGTPVKLVEMQSEAGAISAVHGALDAGVLASSYTASQGLMLMIPTMFRIAGQLKPGVVHVASRNVATSAISIFAEHSDVMACRPTGFAMMASSTVQEAMDLGAVSHLAAIKGHVPFLHYFDGFRTSHEIQKVECLDYEELAKLVDQKELKKFRDNALNPESPVLRTTGQNPDTYFQQREAANPYYEALPDVVESCMDQINELTGRNYKLFNYYGSPEAETVLVGMGSVTGTIQETIDYLAAQGKEVGYLEVHLFRPFSPKHFFHELPDTVKKITVLDRDKEAGAVGEPLFEEICSVLQDSGSPIKAYACRFGLASKDTTPAQIVAMYENMGAKEPRNHYTIGIVDDVTHHSIPYGQELDIIPKGTVSCKFWGLGSDGTVGANKNTIKIIGDHTDMYVQAYFEYDGKKSGGVTKSHLRFGHSPIRSSYLVNKADFVACHNQAYIDKYDIVSDLKEGGNLLIACDWREEDLDRHLPAYMRKAIADKKINLYIIDSVQIAAGLGLGSRTNTVLQSAFFKIADIIPAEDASRYMKEAILKSYGKKGDAIVNMNYAAVDAGVEHLVKVNVPVSWSALNTQEAADSREKPKFITRILEPVNSMKGDSIPVSAFYEDHADGTMPQGTSKYEKRGIAVKVPSWNPDKCIQCNQCAYVCPHAVIRPLLLTKEETAGGPEGLKTAKTMGKGADGLLFHMAISVLDCSGCASCANVCPAKEKALTMVLLEEEREEAKVWDYTEALPEIRNPFGTSNVKGSQFEQPLLEFSGACAGCGETPYAKLVTQLYGDRMYIATATGCSQVWATSFPSFPYTTNKKGQGPAVGGSLFENNAEFGMGICLGADQQRNSLCLRVEEIAARSDDQVLKSAAADWLAHFDDKEATKAVSETLKVALYNYTGTIVAEQVGFARENVKHLVKKSVWMFGGDGWAYDIGYGGLDHVLASGADVNVMVFDTEVYSNTGGQASKATPTGAVAQFAAAGKRTKKKDLGMMAMSYGDVYVAQVAMGASQAQLLKAVKEAESYNGPSLIIAYAPCINHGLRCGMAKVQDEIRRAVEAGYWHLYRYNPMLAKEGKNPFQLDSKEPKGGYREFLRGEVRYSSLERAFPDAADALYRKSEADAKARYQAYKGLAAK
ncbi:pyruvate:ferredoxin (flavodoxin) oxidoreductase [Enterocloster aldenensis]|uniref:pyruvate:ferredoxin (flavodoxin) oxidoreductase n=1 Tax=Enterocloster aldenensis TaxID=358742 RepID=UPI000E4960FB|nr:pyruvate:ferredoxin (flavodoxin) oxidoreductase [Enterocloster aldenensis]